MNEFIKANKEGWATLAKEHYEKFREILLSNKSTLSNTQRDELGDITGKKLIHLQCNIGADTISLARMGASVTGVDLVPENIFYAKKLANELKIDNARFIERDVLDIINKHDEKYDVVYTTEGVLCWLPDLFLWAENIRHLLAKNGFLYLLDGHPFFMIWDEDKLPDLVVRYPYFCKESEKSEWIGGYASSPKRAINYSWMYTIGEIINALSHAGMHIEWFHEFDWLYYNLATQRQTRDQNGNWIFPVYKGKLPFTFSLKATIR